MSSNQNMPTSAQSPQIQYLQGIRGLAILFIVLFHIWPQYFPHGYLGVDVFFVLSGYLLFRSEKKKDVFSFGLFLQKKNSTYNSIIRNNVDNSWDMCLCSLVNRGEL